MRGDSESMVRTVSADREGWERLWGVGTRYASPCESENPCRNILTVKKRYGSLTDGLQGSIGPPGPSSDLRSASAKPNGAKSGKRRRETSTGRQ